MEIPLAFIVFVQLLNKWPPTSTSTKSGFRQISEIVE